MGWGFRKSFGRGPFRITLSKSGISASVGVKGLRLTTGPRGVYVSSSVGGFSYRERIGGRRRSTARPPQPVLPAASYPRFDRADLIESAPVEQMRDLAQTDFATELNEWIRRGNIQLTIVLVTGAVLGLASAAGAASGVIGELLAYGVIAWLLGRFIERRRRRFLLMFDLSPADHERYRGLEGSLDDFASSGRLRAVKLVGHHDEWKRNAGATRSLTFERTSLRRSKPPSIVSNLVPWALETQEMTMYFFPDRVLVWKGSRYAVFSYAALEIDSGTGTFVWDEAVPNEAQVVGLTWQYVRRDGGPDGRFNNNRQIPLVRVAYLAMAGGGLAVVVQTTRVSAAERVRDAMASYAKAATVQDAPASLADSSQHHGALAVLGLRVMPSAAELTRTYRELATRMDPDKLPSSSSDLRVFAEQRLSELKDAYDVLLPHAKEGAGDAVVAEPSVRIRTAASAATHSLRAEKVAASFAVVAALLVFAGARVDPPPVEARDVESTAEPPAAAAAPVTAPTRSARIVTGCTLRDAASAGGARVASIAGGATLEVLEERAGWRRVRDPQGNEGWTGPRCWQASSAKRRPAQAASREPAAGAAPSTEDGHGTGALLDPYADEANDVPPTGSTDRASNRLADPFGE